MKKKPDILRPFILKEAIASVKLDGETQSEEFTTKTITISIQDLCAKLGITVSDNTKAKVVKGKLMLSCNATDFNIPILSVGDKWEMDKYCVCGDLKSEHDIDTVNTAEAEEGAINKYLCASDERKKQTTPFSCFVSSGKSLLATVKAIRLVERCECGHDSQQHDIFDTRERITCICQQFKPVQMVEIEVNV